MLDLQQVSGNVKRPNQRVRFPRRQVVSTTAEQREKVSQTATYTGSPEHKRPGARSDATLCPPELNGKQDQLTAWLRQAAGAGWVAGPWENGFPRRIWCRNEDGAFEGRLTNQELGEYKGYPVPLQDLPAELQGDDA
jgi:hypothetical protein